MKKVVLSLCMSAAVAGLSSCVSTKDAVSFPDMNGEWNMIEIDGAPVIPAPGQEFPFIAFDAKTGQVYGSTGCNRLTGQVDVNAESGRIDLGALGSTRMMCPDMTVEQQVLTALAEVKSYRKLSDGHMALFGSSKRPLVVLQKRERQ
ncbi:MAG: META domain-containing protein [Bacteroides sp.]|nr:META domain-containing protein [Bacteroides sp.]